MQKLFESWKKRKITLFGKKEIINILGISKFIYTASVLPSPNADTIKKINKTIFNFLWDSKDRIKRKTIIGDISKGGIGITDIDLKFKALKATWLVRLIKNNCVNREVIDEILKPYDVDFEYVIKMNTTDIKEFEKLKKLPIFYKEVFISFNLCKRLISIDKMNSKDILQETIWNNKYFKNKGKTIYFKS